MQNFPYNSSAINSAGGNLASIAYLPPSSTGMSLLLFERASAQMQGAITKEVTLTGDISKIALIGAATSGIIFTVTGDLTRNQTVYFGSETVNIGFSADGVMTKLSVFPATTLVFNTSLTGDITRNVTMQGELAKVWALDGSLIRQQILGDVTLTFDSELTGVLGAVQYLSGALDVTKTLDGVLSVFARNYFDYASVNMSFAVSGTLLQTVMMAGNTGMTMDMDGEMSNVRFLDGNVAMQFDVAGLLSNNAGVTDLSGFMMIRRKTNREMTR